MKISVRAPGERWRGEHEERRWPGVRIRNRSTIFVREKERGKHYLPELWANPGRTERAIEKPGASPRRMGQVEWKQEGRHEPGGREALHAV